MPDRAFIRQTLLELLEADTGEKHDALAEDASLREGLGLDSVDVVSIVSQIERRFHIRMSQPELEKLATVADVLDLLEAKLASPPGAAEASAA
jgi:acyl carrier protein